jgi:release factor glutamine methyltransferase
MSVRELLAEGSARLAAAGVDSARLDARVLMGAVLGVTPASVPTLNSNVSASQKALFEGWIKRRLAREPIAYILGSKEFWSLEFCVGPGVLVPRPDSETLIEAARGVFAHTPGPDIIGDLGCGSGCLIITALRLWPRARGVAFDLSDRALHYTRTNASRLGVAERLETQLCDFNQAKGQFDLVLCNPPYLRESELEDAPPELGFEPKLALTAGADGLGAYHVLGAALPRLLGPRAIAVVELGAGQRVPVEQVFLAAGLDVVGAQPDLSHVPRALIARRADKKVVGMRGLRG